MKDRLTENEKWKKGENFESIYGKRILGAPVIVHL